MQRGCVNSDLHTPLLCFCISNIHHKCSSSACKAFIEVILRQPWTSQQEWILATVYSRDAAHLFLLGKHLFGGCCRASIAAEWRLQQLQQFVQLFCGRRTDGFCVHKPMHQPSQPPLLPGLPRPQTALRPGETVMRRLAGPFNSYMYGGRNSIPTRLGPLMCKYWLLPGSANF
jgi:hypothetical protein